MIYAYPESDNTYRLTSDRSSETYNKREQIKMYGGHWDGHNWKIKEGSLKSLKVAVPIKRMHLVIVAAHCHEDEKSMWVTEDDLKRGYVITGCGLCDRSARDGVKAKILEEVVDAQN